ncbi:DUF5343 domain-containing protein [Mesorhizobium sp. BR1-1-2]|uniref:DUF5343 domain-containing protein n=1 Tax=Mesorhizobium sp. BR1-1-2 TaxID=2876652 RepID=UPI001CCC05BA|nr:DUF5343 domain-containing protein [Mesorhizobium sp. BR1-1-2]MBZ9962388.1 DUF5343 domain-containing protein [Mesorhizobium sp. BR1-1-2]
MTESTENKEPAASGTQSNNSSEKQTATQRKIPGNLPYLTASGTLKKTLDRLIEAQRPERFSVDFLENVLKLSGGGARATIPILKKMNFLGSDGTPTELYAKFRTDSGRGAAALQGLRSAFQEIFRRSEYAYSAEESKLKDIIVEVTGLKPTDPVAMAIRSTFNVIKSYIPPNMEVGQSNGTEDSDGAEAPEIRPFVRQERRDSAVSEIGLVYNINIVLPETSDLTVLNAIFRSIKENLMK